LSMGEKRSSSDSLKALIGGSETTTMSVLIKGQDGFTKKLLQKAEDSAEGRIKAMALAEGPFGMDPFSKFSKQNMFANIFRWYPFSQLIRYSAFDCWRHWYNSPNVLSERGRSHLRRTENSYTQSASGLDRSQFR
jgi:hypothetical protein